MFLQSADECSTLDREAAARLLTVANIHHTGHMHGVLLAHVGMRVRLTAKFNATLGLVQEQKATIVDFIFHDVDAAAYRAARPGCVFRPKMLPAAIVLKVDDFKECPVASDLQLYALQVDTASSIFFLEPTEQTFTWRSSQTHHVRRVGFQLTHASYLTTTASQGQTLRKGVTIDCARIEEAGRGMKEGDWWLNLYVMFSRATQMQDMLLLRPPPRSFLEDGPPSSVRAALIQFEAKAVSSRMEAERMASLLSIPLPS